MAYIHTILINEEKASGSTVSSSRRSEKRKYLACVVATTTEATLRHYADGRARAAEELAEWEAKLVERRAAHGMTDAEAEAWWKQAKDRWLTREDMVARGFVDPFDPATPYGICEAASRHRTARSALEYWTKAPALGSQAVLSWHASVALAEKALVSLTTGGPGVRRNGDSLAVRTDIKITETKSRPAREVEGSDRA